VVIERPPTKGEQMITKRALGLALMAAVLAVGGGPIAGASAKPAQKHAKKHVKKHSRARSAQTDQSTTSSDTSGSTSVGDPGATDVGGNDDHCPNM